MAALSTRKIDNMRGIMWMAGAVVLLTVMFAVIRAMAQELPPFVVALMRTATALVFLAPWVARTRGMGVLTARPFGHFLRAFFGISSFACLVWALRYLILSDAIAISFTSPFWTFILSVILIGERARLFRIAATVAGFVGILMIAKPSGSLHPAMALAILSAVLSSSAMITMKGLSTTEPAERIVFYFFFFGTLMLLPFAIATWQTPNANQFAWLVGAGFCGVAGQYCLTRAYSVAEVTVIAPFDFLRLPIAGMLGFAVFAELPDWWSFAGAAIILAAALALARRATR